MSKLKVASIALVCALCLGFSGILFGCGGPQTPTGAADAFMKELKSSGSNGALGGIVDSTDVAGDYSSNDSALFDKEIEELMVKKLVDFDYSLSGEQIDGNMATVQVTIKTYNLGDAFTNFFTKYLQQALVMGFSGASEEDLEKLGVQIFQEEIEQAPKNYEATVPLYLTKVNDKWEVDDIDDQLDFVDAITGGMLTSIAGLAQAFSSAQ